MPSGKLALLSFQNFRVFAMLICSVIHTVSCVPAAKVYHVIPCFSIRWKSKSCLKIINNSLEHSFETEKGNLLWWESNPMPLICQMSTLDCQTTKDSRSVSDHLSK